MHLFLRALAVWAMLIGLAAPAFAQGLGRCEFSKQGKIDRPGSDHVILIDQVEIRCGDESFFADRVEIRTDRDELVATGNVVFTTGSSRIAADSVEFNTRTRTGTFHNASGSASIAGSNEEANPANSQRSHFGTQEPDVYFYGETLEKLGPKKYRVTKGGFSTCVQPVPRWELTSSSVTLNLDEYAILRNSFFKVKGVPVLYLPLFYYPVQEDDRATGFLLPSYGASTFRGQTLSNAFFWAIDRSQDATFTHDWFTKTGQGYGSEYRYTRGRGSDGFVRTYFLREKATEVFDPDGIASETPGRRSHEIRGAMSQRLGQRMRARARADYTSSLEVHQTYHQNIFEATRRQRLFSGSLTGSWSQYTVVGSVDRRETFYGSTDSRVSGGVPRVTVSRSERPLVGPVYFRVAGDYSQLINQRKTPTQVVDQGLARFDVYPRVRAPLARWPFLSINTSAGFRTTYWTESRDESGAQIDQGISRNYYEAQAQITGPVFNRIWTFAESRYAEKLKHSIEPFVTIERVSAVNNFDRIVRFDSVDTIVGNNTRLNYGITNRLYRKPRGGAPSKEILNASIGQTYYTDARAAQFDRRYRTSLAGFTPSNFSPLTLSVRSWPAERVVTNFHTEYDTQFKAFRSMSADGSLELADWLQATGGWSQRRFIEGLPGFNDRSFLDHYLNGSANVRFARNRYGGSHAFNFDVRERRFLQQRMMVYYNAQCCGFAVEYQEFNYGNLSFVTIPKDRRFNFSVTLAGIGTFGNFFGALGGSGTGSGPLF